MLQCRLTLELFTWNSPIQTPIEPIGIAKMDSGVGWRPTSPFPSEGVGGGGQREPCLAIVDRHMNHMVARANSGHAGTEADIGQAPVLYSTRVEQGQQAMLRYMCHGLGANMGRPWRVLTLHRHRTSPTQLSTTDMEHFFPPTWFQKTLQQKGRILSLPLGFRHHRNRKAALLPSRLALHPHCNRDAA
jgi:hypothetical protein